MKLDLLLCLGSVLVGAFNEAAWCVPGDCRVDSNCVDNIHPDTFGRCCGGKCVRSNTVDSRPRLIGERCAPLDIAHPDNYEQCFASCSGGLFCDTTDERCHAKHGVDCPCQANRECLSNKCREGSRTCAGQNLPYGEDCEENNECQSDLCVNKKCSALAIGEICNSFGPPCGPEAVCRRTTTLSFTTYCQSPCAAGEGDCCMSGGYACAKNLVCNNANYSCYAPPPIVLPGLGDPCPSFTCSNFTTMVCAQPCNDEGCNSTRVCQLRNQVAVGLPCDALTSGQCVAGSFCEFNASSYVCTVPPTNAPTGSPTSAPTLALNSVPLGQPCGDSSNYNLCMAPGNMCERNEFGVFVCKQSGMTAIGAFCSISYDSIAIRALDECVKGSRCTKNVSFSSSTCRTPIPVGDRCFYPSNYRDYDYPECANGWDNCEMTGRGCSSCGSNDVNGNPCCTCVVPRTVADGGNCSVSSQCQKASSVCLSENYTCGNIQGIDCIFPSDCNSLGVDSDSRFDCNCDRKCYLLNAPTPSTVSYAPTASTRAPSTYTPPCDAQKKAFDAFALRSTFVPFAGFPQLSYPVFHASFLPEALELTEADQAIVIAYVCCQTCPHGGRFNSHIYASYQVDCAAKKLIKLEDTCNDLRGTLALANCWRALSAAPSLSMGLGAFVAVFLVLL